MKKILLIDDETSIVNSMGALLRSYDYEVVAAVDGLNGLKLAKSEQPDLILCDLNMSPIDGFMTLSILRQQADTAHIPFAVVSGKAEAQDVRRKSGLTPPVDHTCPSSHSGWCRLDHHALGGAKHLDAVPMVLLWSQSIHAQSLQSDLRRAALDRHGRL